MPIKTTKIYERNIMNTQRKQLSRAWEQYERGKEFKRRIGLYDTVKTNERYYRGEQWQYGEGKNLPHPVFNIIGRVINYLVCSVCSSDVTIRYDDETLPYITSASEAEAIENGIATLSSNASYRWKKDGMDNVMLKLLTDAAISGDGVLYCYWDTQKKGSLAFEGDIVTDRIDNVNVFPADVNKADIQSQEYIILSGRASVSSLIAEAERFGASAADIKSICSDDEAAYQAGELSKYELSGDDEAKATYIIKFWRENGKVVFEKSTRNCVIHRARTDCRLYPIVHFNWTPAKNSFHGASPISSLIANQKFINRAYAMAMKHMTDTAFSKVIYDKSKIPEWTNEVGEAIAAYGGGNISDSVSVLGVGEMQSGYMDLINSAVLLTKELMGATDSALGIVEANNTSAILALQETSRIPLEQIRSAYYRAIEQLANVWADMMCAYYPNERLVPYYSKDRVLAKSIDFSTLKNHILSAEIDVCEVSRYSATSVQNMLDKLLDGGFISAEQYVKRLPIGTTLDKDDLIEAIKLTSKNKALKEE